MMMGIIIKDLSNKLSSYIEENKGIVFVTPSWVNNWLRENKAEFKTYIVDKDGNEIKDAFVAITKKSST